MTVGHEPGGKVLLARRQMAVVPTKLQDKRLQSFTPGMWLHLNHIEEGKKQARRQNVVAADLGDIVYSIPCCARYFPPGWFWKKGWIELRLLLTECMLWNNGLSSCSRHTKPPPYQHGCSPKKFCSNHTAFKWLVRHSSTSPKQQQWPLPALLSPSFFYDLNKQSRIFTYVIGWSVEFFFDWTDVTKGQVWF